MATVTKAIRWGGSNQHDAMGAVGSDTSTGAGAVGIQTLVGLKMVVDSALVRDIGRGCKLFTVIPPDTTTVREFKNHLSTKVLKSHIPFDFFNGDYRISDEEDVRIFSLLSEPCKVMPVPQPKSVLSVSSVSAQAGSVYRSTSTPLGMRSGMENGSLTPFSAKRVKFSDIDTSFPLDISAFSNNCTEREVVLENGIQDVLPDATATTGSKRRKRHRKHKSKKNNNTQGESDDAVGENSEEGSPKKSNGIQIQQGHDKAPVMKKRKHGTEYDADESEMDLSQAVQKRKKSKSQILAFANNSPATEEVNGVNKSKSIEDEETPLYEDGSENNKSSEKSEFLSPNTAFLETGYKRVRTSTSGSNKQASSKPCARTVRTSGSGSGFEHSCGEPENGHNCDGIETSGKRKDTPMLPKILKNPCATFDLVKKKMSFEEASCSPETEPSPHRRRPAFADVHQEKQMDADKLIAIEGILGTLDPDAQELGVRVECHSIFMFGDYLYRQPRPDAYITEKGIMFIVPQYDERYSKNGIYPRDETLITCLLSFDDISRAKTYSSDSTPKIVFETVPMFVKKTRNILGLSETSKFDHPREFKLTNSIIIHLTKNVKEEVLTIYTILGTKLSEVGDQGGNEILFIARDPSILEATNGESAVAGPGNNGNTNNSAKTTDVVDSFSGHKENNGGAVAVISADFLKIGDTISFKVLELDEHYTPGLSSIKMAEVLDVNGEVLELKYLDTGDENNKKQRSGVFEIDDEEIESEDLENPRFRNFKELMNPTLASL